MDGISSNSMRMLEKSLEFLWAKQAAHIDNIANAETPGYKVKTVRFEERFAEKLRAAAGAGPRAGRQVRQVIENSTWRVDEDEETTRMDENGVNATEQLIEAVRTAYQMQYVFQSISNNFSMISSAISG